jgi:phage baseplate assembly protein W
MATNQTYGVIFPFRDSFYGTYLSLSTTTDEEIRSNLIHLLLTRKGSRYFLPDFGTRLYEYIFNPLDGLSFGDIESDIRVACEKYLPNLLLKSIKVTGTSSEEDDKIVLSNGAVINRTYSMPGEATRDYTAKVRIDYQVQNNTFASSDFIILNI